jgi:hypothetical protein
MEKLFFGQIGNTKRHRLDAAAKAASLLNPRPVDSSFVLLHSSFPPVLCAWLLNALVAAATLADEESNISATRILKHGDNKFVLALPAFVPPADSVAANSVPDGTPPSTAAVALPLSGTQANLPAFPGAQGFGSIATGGRGGAVYHVTNLNDRGPGSLREGVEHAAGPRTVVFDVGGYISLQSILRVGSDLTIAGQTAPGDGVGLRGAEVSFSGAHNVIIRHVRIRQGLATRQEKKSALNITGGQDMIFDHVSVQWGRWDTVDMNRCRNITFQDCIIGPGVSPQRFGCLCQSENISFIRNLWISNQSRNPKAKGTVQYINNVVYNWGVTGYVGGHSRTTHYADLINNYFIKGPSSSSHFVGEFKPTDFLYQSGNFVDLNCDGELNGRVVTPADFGRENAPTLVASPTVPFGAPFTPDPARMAYEKVVAGAGASLPRDAVDRRLIDDLTSLGRRGQTVRDPEEMGGFGALTGGPAPPDTDGDGMPDFWETANGLNPKLADGNNLAASGYTELEEYLNWLAAPHAVTMWDKPVEVNLRPFAGGIADPRFRVSAATNCVVQLLPDGGRTRVTPRPNFTGRAAFHFAVLNTEGVENTVGILVTPNAAAAN